MTGARVAGETVNLGSGLGGAALFAATFGVADPAQFARPEMEAAPVHAGAASICQASTQSSGGSVVTALWNSRRTRPAPE
jgi:hypothetical protein